MAQEPDLGAVLVYLRRFAICGGLQPNREDISALLTAYDALAARLAVLEADRPAIVCLCGSTRFWRTFQQASLQETLAGKIVLSIGAATGSDDDHFAGYMPKDEYDAVKRRLDALHFRKIEMADEVLILNVEDYIGTSTKNELQHARNHGKRVRWLYYPSQHMQDGEGQ